MKRLHDDLKQIRTDYSSAELGEQSILKDPFRQFKKWMEEAILSQVPEPTAMSFATVNLRGRPSVRILLLKGFDERGFCFYSNYNSRKAQEIERNAWSAMTFFWPELERQVRVEGFVTKISVEESDEYFLSRPRESRLGAWASPQSETIPNREYLDEKVGEATNRFESKEVTRPPYWGGYLLSPDRIEFWQGRLSRLHDRILYSLQADSSWKIERLAP